MRRAAGRSSPVIVPRPRIYDWLLRHANMPLRLVVAPAASGKTTALIHYVDTCAADAFYFCLSGSTTVEQVRRAIAGTFDDATPPSSYDQLVTLILTRQGVCEFVFDDFDLAASDVREELNALLHDSPAEVTYTYVSRTRGVVNFGAMMAHGTAVLCGASVLNFSGQEIADLADAMGVPYAAPDVARLEEESDGWAAVVSASIRHALTAGRSLRMAYECWHSEIGHLFVGFIDAEVARAFPQGETSARKILSGAKHTQADLEQLEQRGLFVKRIDDVYEPYRPVLRLLRQYAAPADEGQHGRNPLIIRLLGRFEATINGRPVLWVRRRDQQIFKYVLLKTAGSATRQELIEVFWPGAEDHLASQSLRTVCSNIRKSLSALVANKTVEDYFTADAEITINFERTVVDVRRFSEHVRHADDDYAQNNMPQARAHYRAAERLYRGTLHCDDESQEWFFSKAKVFESMFRSVLERLAAIAIENHDAQTASVYIRQARKLQAEGVKESLPAALLPPAVPREVKLSA